MTDILKNVLNIAARIHDMQAAGNAGNGVLWNRACIWSGQLYSGLSASCGSG